MRISDWSSDVCSSDLLSSVLPYKSGRGRTPEARRETFGVLPDHLEAIGPLQLPSAHRWLELRVAVAEATRQMHLEAIEDELDAILCEHLAWLWHNRHDAARKSKRLHSRH